MSAPLHRLWTKQDPTHTVKVKTLKQSHRVYGKITFWFCTRVSEYRAVDITKESTDDQPTKWKKRKVKT